MSLIPEFITESTYGIPNWLLIVFTIMLIVFIIKLMKSSKKPKLRRKSLKKDIRKEINEVFKTFSVKTPLRNKMSLRHGYLKIGNIRRITLVNWVHKEKIIRTRGLKKVTKQQKLDVRATEILQKLRGIGRSRVKIKTRAQKFYLIEAFKDNLLGHIKHLIGWKGIIFLIDKKKLIESGDQFIIDVKSAYSYYMGVFIFSGTTKDYITDLAFKGTFEEILDELYNYVPKINYLEVSLAGTISALRERYKLEKEKYSTRTDQMLRGETST